MFDYDVDDVMFEGLFVEGFVDVEIGNLVCFYGEVEENYGMIIFVMDSDVVVFDCGIVNVVVVVEFFMLYEFDFEIVEGMVVSVIDVIVMSINNLWCFGEIVVSDIIKC